MKLYRYGQALESLGPRDRYHLEGMLGSGGMAEVYLAWDTQEHQKVALKILKSGHVNRETLGRFTKEAQQIAAWQHPHILRVYTHVQVEWINRAKGEMLFYLVMEYARGGDLQKRLQPGKPFPLSASFALFHQLCEAVQYAHEQGIIHRDLKPLNILFRRTVDSPEEVVLSDFGLAVEIDASHHTFAHGGTLAYMAPEQFRGNALLASDIFALGVILYQLCTGQVPFRRTIQDLSRKSPLPSPMRPSLLNSALPPELDEPMLRALRERPSERYQSAQEFWDAIALALTLTAQTHPFLSDAFWQAAGQTTPSTGSEQPSQWEPEDTNGSQSNGTGRSEGRAGRKKKADRSQQENLSSSLPSVQPAGRRRLPQPAPTRRARQGEASHPGSNTFQPVSRQQPGARQLLLSPKQRVPTQRKRLFLRAMAALLVLLAVLVVGWSALHRPGAPNLGTRQLSLTNTSPTKSAEANASGSLPATTATGYVELTNEFHSPLTIQGQTLRDKKGIAIRFGGPVTIPANPPLIAVQGFAVNPGAAGNIPAFDFLETCCAPNGEILVKNEEAFTGGKDAQPVIQQNDIDNATHQLVVELSQDAQANLKKQIAHNEQVVENSLQCNPATTANHHAGDIAQTVTVTGSVTCRETVDASQAAQASADGFDLGASYPLDEQSAAGDLCEEMDICAGNL